MVQSYLRHGPTEAFGLVCSSSSNSHYDGKLAYVPTLEDVLVWDMKKGQMLAMWHETGHRAEVTCIGRSPQKDHFAVGYADGSVRLWSASSASVLATFNGHKKAVTALAFDESGTRLASGSQDTDLILWDVVGEAGLYRLRGHRDQITAIRFLRPVAESAPSTSTGVAPGFLLTGSKDTFMKLWDLSTQHCIQTIVAHRSELWTLDLDPEQNLAFTGSGDGEMKVWKVDHEALAQGLRETENGGVSKFIHPATTLPLASSHKVSQISFHPHKPFLAVQSHDKSVEVFRIRTEDEIKKKQARRRKRAKEKEQEKKDKSKHKGEDTDIHMEGEQDEPEVAIANLFQPYVIVRASGKVRSFHFDEEDSAAKGSVHLFVALSSNALEVYSIPPPTKSKDDPPEASRIFSVDIPGHRSDVRTLCLSSDDGLLASASNGSLKIWNMKTIACIRTMDCGYAICSTFLPGDRQVAVGTKSGEILIYDIASSTLVDTLQAHSGTVWSIHVRPDETGLVSGSADKDVKFWDFERKPANSENPRGTHLLTLVHVRTLKMTDDVLSVRYSPNGKLLAVALLDSTVKVFYQDTLKFFLSLYGHKLPVLSMDISGDSKLIVTCSADKNVKIWGLDFGDCHKSLFAHDESVMQVAFERNDTRDLENTKPSHYFWTVGKDKMVKYWDGDRFENIQKLEGHHSEVWALAVSHHGKFVVTGSHDKSIRVWEKLDEPLFLEEERERELEALYETGIADSLNREDAPIGSGAPGADPAAAGAAETGAVSKQTTETLMAGERIMEALDLADNELEQTREYEEALHKGGLAPGTAPPPRHPILAAYDRVNGTALYDALLVLPFGKVVSLMRYLNHWAQKEWNIVLTARIIFFLLKTHHHQIVANRVMRTALIPLRRSLRDGLRRQKETIGYNLAALRFVQRQNDARRTAEFFEREEAPTEEEVRAKIAEGGKKRKRVNVKA
ncbi:WD-repeat-containing protein [Epithele typhae]|uniref:WD-repeat-containing protein n=1 Tax=Epithele typhae TaxID=378194 RepID=UPI002008E78C|nr:WD-repeat-containing protein [Epithele typhae]KAH9943346.1 WD-repeat-containing protein [Epithele typhae]